MITCNECRVTRFSLWVPASLQPAGSMPAGLPCGACLVAYGCLMAAGARQELMLILEELWERTPGLRNVPIYQASGQAKRALSIFQTYIEMMNEDIRRAFKVACLALPQQAC